LDIVNAQGDQRRQEVDSRHTDLSKASVKRVEHLLEVFEEIDETPEITSGLLRRFQTGYLQLPREEKAWFFEILIRRFEIHKGGIVEGLQRVQRADEEDAIAWSALLTSLRRDLESPRMRAFRKLLNISGGLKFLLDLRADVLTIQRQALVNLEPLDEEIAHLFNSWFQQGFLFIQEITRDSSFRQIRFLKEHDMVHPMTSLEEMGDRLGEDRRCFALYHLAMPDEPVVFIEVALTKGIVRTIHEIIGDQVIQTGRKGKPDTAIFYSINNTQNGLAGIGLGKVLIFQVVEALKKDNSDIGIFCTLSPMPGFWERYFKCILQGEDAPFSLKRHRLSEFFPEKIQEELLERHEDKTGREASSLYNAMVEIFSDPQWIDDPNYVQLLKKPMTELAHYYITHEKNEKGKPRSPVANFHLGNGATVSIRNVNFAANRSRRGLEESCGMMVNYVYSTNWLQQIGQTVQSLLPWKVK
jgi:malonyl-CoA decarboxylase